VRGVPGLIGTTMLTQLEMIVGKVANAPRPGMPPGLKEQAPDQDSTDMLRLENGIPFLPVALIFHYEDEFGNVSVRRVTLISLKGSLRNGAIMGFCHVRQDVRRFAIPSLTTVSDPARPSSSGPIVETLGNFLCAQPEEEDMDLRALLCRARDELTVLMFFARCDGYLHPSERRVMVNFITEKYADYDCEPDEIWDFVARLYPDSRTMVASAKAIAKDSGNTGLKELQGTIRALIEADGLLHTNELMHAIELAYVD